MLIAEGWMLVAEGWMLVAEGWLLLTGQWPAFPVLSGLAVGTANLDLDLKQAAGLTYLHRFVYLPFSSPCAFLPAPSAFSPAFCAVPPANEQSQIKQIRLQDFRYTSGTLYSRQYYRSRDLKQHVFATAA